MRIDTEIMPDKPRIVDSRVGAGELAVQGALYSPLEDKHPLRRVLLEYLLVASHAAQIVQIEQHAEGVTCRSQQFKRVLDKLRSVAI